MQVAKWGNSLAVRIPAMVVTKLDLKEGDEIEIIASPGRFELASADREQAMATVRRLARSLPPGWKISREEANARAPDEA